MIADDGPDGGRCECGGNDMDRKFIAVHEWGYHTREKCAPWSAGQRRALATLRASLPPFVTSKSTQGAEMTRNQVVILLIVLCVLALFVPLGAPHAWGYWSFGPIGLLLVVLILVLVL